METVMRQVKFEQSTDGHVNLTEFVTIIGFYKYGENRRFHITVSMPSQGFKREDGTLTLQARVSGDTVKGVRHQHYDWIGIDAQGYSNPLKF
jgi:hypothetical protein